MAVRHNIARCKELLPVVQRTHWGNAYRSRTGPSSRCFYDFLEVIGRLKHALLFQRCPNHGERLVNTTMGMPWAELRHLDAVETRVCQEGHELHEGLVLDLSALRHWHTLLLKLCNSRMKQVGSQSC